MTLHKHGIIPRCIAAASATAILASLSALPAQALSDTTITQDSPHATVTLANQQLNNTDTTMPDNPNVELPTQVSKDIPDNATVVAQQYAVTQQGELKNIETGQTVTDENLIGTQDTPPDPLNKTDGESFIPVPAVDVKDAVEDNGGDAEAETTEQNAPNQDTDNATPQDSPAQEPQENTDQPIEKQPSEAENTLDSTAQAQPSQLGSSDQHHVQLASFVTSEYGAHWGTYNGTKAFFDAHNGLFVQEAKGVIDVSEHQGVIDWNKAKADGVQGAIIRIGYGAGNLDRQAQRNVSECKRLGIPFGMYLYSYAYDANFARQEATETANMLRRIGVSPNNLSYPLYYDLEHWSWTGHTTPTNPNVYNAIVDNFYNTIKAQGYSKLGVYSYTNYLNTALNHNSIHAKTSWVAQYGPTMQYTKFGQNQRGWQYTSSGTIRGINGRVDMNAFGVRNPTATGPDIQKLDKTTIPDGDYYINLALKDTSSFDVPSASTNNNVPIQSYNANHSSAQIFRFVRQSDGSYIITNKKSGKALEASGGKASSGTPVIQNQSNNAKAQRWFLRNNGSGGLYIQSALGNYVMDVPNGNSANGNKIRLWQPNLTASQQFYIASTKQLPTGNMRIIYSKDRNKVLDISSASTNNGARPVLYSWNGGDNQIFTLQQSGNGIYEIINIHSGKVFDVKNGTNANGQVVQQYQRNGSKAQRWYLRDYGNNKVSFISEIGNKALDIPGGSTSSWTGLTIYNANGTSAQQWILESTKSSRDKLNDLAHQNKNVIANGIYRIALNNNTHYSFDIAGGSRAKYANLQLYTNNRTKAQQFKITHDSRGYITITNVNSSLVLDVENGVARSGSNIRQYPSNGTYAQKWIAVKTNTGIKLISALNSNAVIDLANGQIRNSNNIRIYSSNNTGSQRWRFIKE